MKYKKKTYCEEQHLVNSRYELLTTRQQFCLVVNSSYLEFTRCCSSEYVFFLYCNHFTHKDSKSYGCPSPATCWIPSPHRSFIRPNSDNNALAFSGRFTLSMNEAFHVICLHTGRTGVRTLIRECIIIQAGSVRVISFEINSSNNWSQKKLVSQNMNIWIHAPLRNTPPSLINVLALTLCTGTGKRMTFKNAKPLTLSVERRWVTYYI